jgi:hypothetical protein
MKKADLDFLANLQKEASSAREQGRKTVNVFKANEPDHADGFLRLMQAMRAGTAPHIIVDKCKNTFKMRTAVINSCELTETIEGSDGVSYDKYSLITRDKETNQTLRAWTIRATALDPFKVGDLVDIPTVHIPFGTVAINYGKESAKGAGDGIVTLVEPIDSIGCFQTFSQQVAEKLSLEAVGAYYASTNKLATSLKAETAVKDEA